MMTITKQMVVDKLFKIFGERSLYSMGELLDSPHDMYDLGYIDSELEQAVLDYLADEKFVAVYAIHDWVNNRENLDFEYTFNAVAEEIVMELNEKGCTFND